MIRDHRLAIASLQQNVFIQLGQFKAFNFEELFQGVRAPPLEQWIGKMTLFR
ncbi:MAG: hypothetical protein ACLUOF_09905 [Ruminococcus sp.]